MSYRTRRSLTLALIALLIVTVCALAGGVVYAMRLPHNLGDQETLIVGQSRLEPGAPGTLHVRVQRHADAAPVAGADVEVRLQPADGGQGETLFAGTTAADGTLVAAFTVPQVQDPRQEIVVKTRSDLGRDELRQAVTVERSFKVLLTTDKPIYQPGQQILIRALALGAFDRRPATGSPVEVTVADAKGNKVFRQTATASEYGIASWTFQLAAEGNHGNYKISARLADTSSEKTVVVKPYVLPKFKVSVTTDASYYRPGQEVSGQVSAAYFFGKPVDGGQVRLTGWVYDVERQQVLDLAGTTGPDGTFAFHFPLPEYLVGAAERGVADFLLEVAVIDGAAHTEQVSQRLPVAQQGIIIEAVLESGQLKPGLDNIIYLLTAYPDGSPAQCELAVTLDGTPHQASTGPYGLGELHVIPQSPNSELWITAHDALGQQGEVALYLEGRWSNGYVLLRPERATYDVGETLNVEVLATGTEQGSAGAGSAYLDITREGQTLSTRALDLVDGRATAAVDLTPDLYGTLTLHAYILRPTGEIVRDTRLIVVEAATDLTLDVRLDRETYLPGDPAHLDIGVTGAGGEGVPSALGLAIVDESVFALQEQDPGFARLYFLLEQELLEPKFDLHGLTLPQIVAGNDLSPASPEAEQARGQAARAALAGFGSGGFGLTANSHLVKQQEAEARMSSVLGGLSRALYVLLLVIPLGLVAAVGYGLRRDGVLARSLAVGAGLPVLVVIWAALMLWVVPMPGAPWAEGPLDKLGYLIDEMGALLVCLAGPVLLGGIISTVGLAVRAVRRDEVPLGIAVGLLATYALLLPLLFVAVAAGQVGPPSTVTILLFALGYLALPLAFGARAAGFAFKREGWALTGTALVAVMAFFLIAGPVAALASLDSGLLGGNLAMGGIEPPMGMVMEEVVLDGAFAGAPAPALAVAPQEAPVKQGEAATRDGETQRDEAPLLRQFFPETMYWNPQAVTDAGGRWSADLETAHTITTWRLTALASAQDGRLGSATAPIRVFQDFFVDIDLPLALTQGDEVSMPVAVYNYLDTGQQVRLALEAQDWFELAGPAEQVVDVEPGDVTVVYFPIKVTAVEGYFRPIVHATGTKMSDATTLRHDVQVVPNGKRLDQTLSDRLSGDVDQTITIPSEAIPGTAQILVKIYPGVLSQVVEGLDALLRMPYGCFEQTSSTTYPNVLVLDYLKSTDQASPETRLKAEQYINLGYQRLTTFEVPGGGFSLFGQAPADRMLTAYGLMEFGDMSRVHPVDEDLIDRAAQWLLSQQAGDGSWENDQGLVHEESWSSLGNARLPVTAYITWALTEAGYGDDTATQLGLDYVRELWRQAEDPYALALVANALVAADPKGGATGQALDALAEMAVIEGNGAYWQSGVATFMGATGETGSIETTALAAYAFLKADRHMALANQALTYLIQQKDSYGTWHSTQATVLTLKALLLSVTRGGEGSQATVHVSLNGEEADPIQITPDNFDVVQLVSFTDKPVTGDNHLRIAFEGQGSLMYQVSTRYYLPWDQVPMMVEGEPLMAIDVAYDRTELAVNDTIEVAVRVELKEGAARQTIVDLGVPPGFEVAGEDLADVVARHSDLPQDSQAKISRFDLTGRQIIVYVENLKAGQALEFGYRIRARYPIKAQTPPSSAYDYYNPGVSVVSAPAAIQVTP